MKMFWIKGKKQWWCVSVGWYWDQFLFGWHWYTYPHSLDIVLHIGFCEICFNRRTDLKTLKRFGK